MMICKCGNSLKPEMKYCPKCGNKIEVREYTHHPKVYVESIKVEVARPNVEVEPVVLRYSRLAAFCYVPFLFLLCALKPKKDERLKASLIQGLILSIITLLVLFITYLLHSDGMNVMNLFDGTMDAKKILFILLYSFVPFNSLVGFIVNFLGDRSYKIFFFGYFF